MKGNNNNSESWQFTTCWLEISDSAVSAEIKTLCLHVEFKTRFELWSWCYTNPCTVPENSLLNFCTLYRSGWASTRCLCTVLVNTSCYRCSNRCGFLLQTQCVFKRKRLLFIAFKDLSARSSTRFPQTEGKITLDNDMFSLTAAVSFSDPDTVAASLSSGKDMLLPHIHCRRCWRQERQKHQRLTWALRPNNQLY